MKTLLVILIFQLIDGRPGEVTTAQRLFADEASCLSAGAETTARLPAGVHAIATCVPEVAFRGVPQAYAPSAPAAGAPAAGAPANPAPTRERGK